LAKGDVLLPMKSYVGEPITLTVENGFVTSIDGDAEAELLREYIESFDDPEAYAISHVGWGLQKRAFGQR
jgi:2,5-dihydroxypyridine 5,6-dioxygenase